MIRVSRQELITVVVPIYNIEKYLKKCIESIISQTYKNIEIILVDDGSKDNSSKICDEYSCIDKRIKVIHKKNGGLSDARNEGIKNARGKYITFIDGDDYVSDDYIKILYETLKKYDADISIGGHVVIYENNKKIEKYTNQEFVTDSKEVLYKILYDNGIDLSACSKLYKISLFDNITYPVGVLYEDAATTYKLIDSAKKIAVCSKPIYNYVIRRNSITNNSFTEKKLDLIKSTKEMTDYIKNKYPDLESACNRRLMYAYLSTLTQLAKSKNKNKDIQDELVKYIKKNSIEILKDTKVPKRDKFGIISIFMGFNTYKLIWKLYYKISGRE